MESKYPTMPNLVVLRPEEVKCPCHYFVLIYWGALHFHKHVVKSERGWLNYFSMLDYHKHRIQFADGSKYTLPASFKVFTDERNKWMNSFLATDETGIYPLTHCDRTEKPIWVNLVLQMAYHQGYLPPIPRLPGPTDKWPLYGPRCAQHGAGVFYDPQGGHHVQQFKKLA